MTNSESIRVDANGTKRPFKDGQQAGYRTHSGIETLEKYFMIGARFVKQIFKDFSLLILNRK